MDLDYLTRLTVSLYKLSEELEDGLLRLKLKRLGAEVLRDFARFEALNPKTEHGKEVFSSISELKSALRWARRNKELERKEFLGLREEYEKVESLVRGSLPEEEEPEREEKKRDPGSEKEKPEKEQNRLEGLKKRQKKVLSILERKERAQVSELKKFFPEISKRTLRRDIDTLLSRDLILRKGRWNDVYYVLG